VGEEIASLHRRPILSMEVFIMRLMYFPDLRASGLVQNWNTLNNWIDNKGFPPGRLIANKRVWTEAEILAWIESQPSNRAPLRGHAKRVAAPKMEPA
jgi:hypothetical protein